MSVLLDSAAGAEPSEAAAGFCCLAAMTGSDLCDPRCPVSAGVEVASFGHW